METVVVTYGNGIGKKGSVRLEALTVEDSAVSVTNVGDFYVSRDIMNKLGLKDTDAVKVTFEKA